MSARTTIAGRRLAMTLQAPVETADPIGGVTRSWADVATLWARLEPLARAVERAEAQRPEAALSHRLTLRWRADVTPAMRFAAAGQFYGVRATHDPDGRRRDLVCLVEEVQE